MSLVKSFLKHCENKKYEINQRQIDIIKDLDNYYKNNFNVSFFSRILKKKNKKFGFYLVGDVGVGKTMISNFIFQEIKESKLRLHFNEFMIQFHDYIFKNKEKENGIENFVKDLNKKAKLLYFDEFQVTNIVDAMILGKLFKKIFEQKINVIFTSNIKINDLYKDGLQRDQFLPFIEILENHCIQKELSIDEDYRLSKKISSDRFLTPINNSNNFIFNKFLRKLTKNRNKSLKVLEIKGRELILKDFYEGVFKLNFDSFFNQNLGSEDYIAISKNCSFILIENLVNFNEDNSNQQQRFITFIDIIYEEKIPLMITSETSLDLIQSSKSMVEPFKRTKSRLYELSSIKYNL